MPIPLPGLTLALALRDWWLSRNAHQHDASCDCSDYSPQHDQHAYTGLPARAALQITLEQMLNPKVVVMEGDIPTVLQDVFAMPEFGEVRGVVVHNRMVDVHYTDGSLVQFIPVVGARYNGGV